MRTLTRFEAFCQRMWLDYCDENNDPISAPDRLVYEEYVTKYKEYLHERWIKGRPRNNGRWNWWDDGEALDPLPEPEEGEKLNYYDLKEEMVNDESTLES